MTASTPSPAPSLTTQLTAGVRLQDILKTLPRECFERNPRKAWTGVLLNILMVALGYGAIALAPWFLLPFAWIFTGTALTGFFVIGHDGGHRSFAKQTWLNDLVGHLFMLPLIYPFHSWRLLHDHHHRHTNEMDEDNAWQPFRPEDYQKLEVVYRWFYQAIRGRFWWLGSIAHWAAMHFNWGRFEGKQRSQVRFSVLVVLAFAGVFFPVLFLTTGIWGFVKFWLLPWLVYHFWMSTFTLVHHTAPEIAFQETAAWDAVAAQLRGTVHCDYPGWVEFLCHDINVHVPHHLSTAIPSYNLRLAHHSLRQNWGDSLRECRFSWTLMEQITRECHLYDRDRAYVSFQECLLD